MGSVAGRAVRVEGGSRLGRNVGRGAAIWVLASILAGLVHPRDVASAQEYPSRPITLVVAFAAGGPTDAIARIVGEHMSRTLGQKLVVENVAGAGGTIGTARAAQAAPDGYTLILGQMGTHSAAPGLYSNLKYDPESDFQPIGLVGATHIVIVEKKTLPARSLGDLVSYIKLNKDKVT